MSKFVFLFLFHTCTHTCARVTVPVSLFPSSFVFALILTHVLEERIPKAVELWIFFFFLVGIIIEGLFFSTLVLTSLSLLPSRFFRFGFSAPRSFCNVVAQFVHASVISFRED